jgi:ribosome biogenesis GTPase / thiamine phosphate phosphatase
MIKTGLIIKNISNSYLVKVDNLTYNCIPRGKLRYLKVIPCVGDHVSIDTENKIILEILPRKNNLERPNVSNIDLAIIMTSLKEPNLSLNLLDKELLVVEQNKIKPIIVYSKLDLLNEKEKEDFKKIFNYYQELGYPSLYNTEINKLKHLLSNKIVVITGQTGSGKSSLINHLNPSLELKTSPISKSLGRGIHTTRNTELYSIDDFYIVDTPGFSSLNINNLKEDEVKNYFPDFKKYKCDFKDCNHLKNCAVTNAIKSDTILESRYNSYLQFYKECYESSRKLFK